MKFTTEDLHATLWEALDSARGAQPLHEAMTCLLALLVLKRASDASEQGESVLSLPPSTRWSSVRAAHLDLPQAIVNLARAFESENDSVPDGLLSELPFGGRGAGGTHGLARLVSHLSGIDLGGTEVDASSLGEVSERLLVRLAEAEGRHGGESFTPPGVRDLVVRLLDPQGGTTVCDPACGAATFLTGAAKHSTMGGSVENVSLFGQEKYLETWRLGVLNLLLHEQVGAKVALGDTLLDPAVSQEDGSLRKFDRILCAPPFSLSRWGHREAEVDPHGRFRYGLPPSRTADFAFVQHVLASLKSPGRAVMVVAPGVLFRSGREGEIRARLVGDDRVEAVVSLGPNLFYGTGIPAAILVFASEKSADRREKVIFINASDRFENVRGRNLLRPEDCEAIVEAYQTFADSPGFARIVARAEIEENECILDVKRYVQLPPAKEDHVDLARLRQQVVELEEKRTLVLENMDRLLQNLMGVSHGK